ncbi:MAG: TetR/AcrR family transcriptional regulator [Clostridia bacterium]|nr:TetR/AcrR family transcriptional regulator [Clostridia bacterium]
MKKTFEEAAFTKNKILDAALMIFSTKGYGETTLNEIAKAANTTRATVYHHFENKKNLFAALINEVNTMINDVVQSKIEDQGTTFDTLKRISTDILDQILGNEKFLHTYRLIHNTQEDMPKIADIIDILKERKQKILKLIVYALQIAVDEGEIQPKDLSPEDIATAFLAYLSGLIHFCQQSPEHKFIKEKLDIMIDIFFAGLEKKYKSPM